MRAIEDGQYVFLHAYQSLDDGKAKWVTTDFFDTENNDRIIEHRDVISEYSPETPSGHTSIDGPTEITDLDKTEQNKQLVHDLIHDVLIGENPEDIDNYISSKEYVQHNEEVADGLGNPLALAPDKPLIYEEIVLLVGQANFVATLCNALWKK